MSLSLLSRRGYCNRKITFALKTAREALGLSQRELGERVGAPQSHIAKIEQGAADLRVPSLIELVLVPRKSVPAVDSIVCSMPFFSNLLPEGHLRSYLAERAGVSPQREFSLLWVLGKDLPGAATIEPADGEACPRCQRSASGTRLGLRKPRHLASPSRCATQSSPREKHLSKGSPCPPKA